MADDKKKYPLSKSIFNRKKKEGPIRLVYAGPQRIRPRRGDARGVYAGPEFYAQKPKSDAPKPDTPMPVYAGPEFFGAEGGRAPVSGTPVPDTKPDGEPAKCVYAGPEYFGAGRRKNRDAERDEPEADPGALANEADIEEVYAGPEFFEGQLDGDAEPCAPEDEVQLAEDCDARAPEDVVSLAENRNADAPADADSSRGEENA